MGSYINNFHYEDFDVCYIHLPVYFWFLCFCLHYIKIFAMLFIWKRYLLYLLGAILFTSNQLSAQRIDELYNLKIKEYTTDQRFLPSSVLNLVTNPKIPSPQRFFGTIIGAPGVMHRTKEIYSYFNNFHRFVNSGLKMGEGVGVKCFLRRWLLLVGQGGFEPPTT